MENRVYLHGCSRLGVLGGIVLALVAMVSLTGCYQPESPPTLLDVNQPPTTENRQGYWVAGYSVQGQPILVQTLGNGPETVLLMATIHGNEAAGTPLLGELSRYLKTRDYWLQGRRVVLINIVNPDGWRADTRGNAHGVDLNRNFTTANRINNHTNGTHGLSEPEAVVLKNVILKYQPARIISLHQPLECIDYDGPGEALAMKMAKSCFLPVKKLGARPGSLGSFAGETLGIPLITLEMRDLDSQLTGPQLWTCYGRALLAAIEG